MALMWAWMDWLGLAVGISGLAASIVGVVFAIKAQRAARSAEQAANEARNSVSQTLCLVSAQRALSVISRLNTLHRNQSWDAALELYRELRTLLNDIIGTTPDGLEQSRERLVEGIGQLRLIQSLIGNAIGGNSEPENVQVINDSLDSIQTTLETQVRNMMPSGESDGEPHG